MKLFYFFLPFLLFISCGSKADVQAKFESTSYLQNIKQELKKQYPNNRTINLVFHGHSVPTGYQVTPEIKTFESYPFLLLKELKKKYPNSSINVIITSIGGEESDKGAERFERDVLIHKPDILFIDYGLNDRRIGLAKAKNAWCGMIEKALDKNIKIILLTPSPDLDEGMKENCDLSKHTAQIKQLAVKYNVGLCDSYNAFRNIALQGNSLSPYMAQSNHPNEKGNSIIAQKLLEFFL